MTLNLCFFFFFFICCCFGGVCNKYYCGAREFMVSAHFPLGPKARAEESSCREQVVKVQMA